MPISYVIDYEKGLIVETWTGDVAAADLAEHWRHYLADPDVLAIRSTLVDLRACRILFTGAQLAAMVDAVAAPKLGGRDWRTALLADSPVQFGVSRQYQVFAEHYSRDSIFTDKDEDGENYTYDDLIDPPEGVKEVFKGKKSRKTEVEVLMYCDMIPHEYLLGGAPKPDGTAVGDIVLDYGVAPNQP